MLFFFFFFHFFFFSDCFYYAPCLFTLVLQVDLDHLESLADSSTACILICNPSNPTGSVFSEAHLRAIVATAEKLKVPILSDEVGGKNKSKGGKGKGKKPYLIY